jgi:hypothetical protein
MTTYGHHIKFSSYHTVYEVSVGGLRSPEEAEQFAWEFARENGYRPPRWWEWWRWGEKRPRRYPPSV